jgi:hypothetical protein
MAGPGGADRVNGDPRVSVGAVFKAHRAGERGGHLAMDLAFGSARAHRPPANQVGNKLTGHHIEKLSGGRQPQRVDPQQQVAGQGKAVIHAATAVEIRIGNQPFPAHHGARLLKIGAHNDFQSRPVLFTQRPQARGVVDGGVGIVN